MNFSAKSASFREKARKIVNLAKNFQFFKQNTMSYGFGEFFSKQFHKVPHFAKKHEKSSIWPKTSKLSNKLPSSKLLVNFSAKSASFGEEGRKIVDLAKNFKILEQTAMFRRFDELSSKKLQKVTHFVKKHEKSSIWPRTGKFSTKLPCFDLLTSFLAKSCKKYLIW